MNDRIITVILIALHVAITVVTVSFTPPITYERDADRGHDARFVFLVGDLGQNAEELRRRGPVGERQGLYIVQRRRAAMRTKARELHPTPEPGGLQIRRNADEGDGAPRRLRGRLHVHEEELAVFLAAEDLRARFVDAEIELLEVIERRGRPAVVAGEVVQELLRRTGEAAARLRA